MDEACVASAAEVEDMMSKPLSERNEAFLLAKELWRRALEENEEVP
jgi:hypothetical protein